jgi:hypothetical protein
MNPILTQIKAFSDQCVHGLKAIGRDNSKVVATAGVVTGVAIATGLVSAIAGAGAASFFISAAFGFGTFTAIAYIAGDNKRQREIENLANAFIGLSKAQYDKINAFIEKLLA